MTVSHHQELHAAPGEQVSSILLGASSIAWYILLTVFSTDGLADSIASLGLMIAFYLGLTGLACTVYYRRQLFASVKNLLLVWLAPLTGGMNGARGRPRRGACIRSRRWLASPRSTARGS
jgi:hypothetical protein